MNQLLARLNSRRNPDSQLALPSRANPDQQMEALTERVAEALIQRISSQINPVNNQYAVAHGNLPDPNNPAATQAPYGNQFYAQALMYSPMGAYAMNNPINFSTPNAPTMPPLKWITTQQMRAVSKQCDIVRACISHLKREVAAVPILFTAKDPKDQTLETQRQIEQANLFIETDGGLGPRGEGRNEFEALFLEDLIVIGAAAFHYRQGRGGRPISVDVIQSDTIRPVVDAFGWPPDVDGSEYAVYEQWILGTKIAGFTRDQMRYKGLYPVSYSPFYDSVIEYIIYAISALLQSTEWNLTWLTSGTSVDDMYEFPESFTPEQTLMWLGLINSMVSGDSRMRRQAMGLPAGAKKHESNRTKDFDLAKYQEWEMRIVLSNLGVSPASIGFAGMDYQDSQAQTIETTTNFGAGILFQYRKDFYDDLCKRMGWDRIVCQNEVVQVEDLKAKAETNEIAIRSGTRSPNELRIADGLDPYEGGDAMYVLSTYTPVNLPQSESQTMNQDGDDKSAPNNQDGPRDSDSDTDTDTDIDEDANRIADLRRWESKSLNRLRKNKGARCEFDSVFIPVELSCRVSALLTGATNQNEVSSIFRKAESNDDDLDWSDEAIAANTEDIPDAELQAALDTSTPAMVQLLTAGKAKS